MHITRSVTLSQTCQRLERKKRENNGVNGGEVLGGCPLPTSYIGGAL